MPASCSIDRSHARSVASSVTSHFDSLLSPPSPTPIHRTSRSTYPYLNNPSIHTHAHSANTTMHSLLKLSSPLRPALPSLLRIRRTLSSSLPSHHASHPPKTGILMLNMGGPTDPSETGPFLKRLFTDPDIINLGGGYFQEILGRIVSTRRTPRIAKQYEEIGGSPIGRWTKTQGEAMRKLLDAEHPSTGPHKFYVGFR